MLQRPADAISTASNKLSPPPRHNSHASTDPVRVSSTASSISLGETKVQDSALVDEILQSLGDRYEGRFEHAPSHGGSSSALSYRNSSLYSSGIVGPVGPANLASSLDAEARILARARPGGLGRSPDPMRGLDSVRLPTTPLTAATRGLTLEEQQEIVRDLEEAHAQVKVLHEQLEREREEMKQSKTAFDGRMKTFVEAQNKNASLIAELRQFIVSQAEELKAARADEAQSEEQRRALEELRANSAEALQHLTTDLEQTRTERDQLQHKLELYEASWSQDCSLWRWSQLLALATEVMDIVVLISMQCTHVCYRLLSSNVWMSFRPRTRRWFFFWRQRTKRSRT